MLHFKKLLQWHFWSNWNQSKEAVIVLVVLLHLPLHQNAILLTLLSCHSPVKPYIFHYTTDFPMTSKFANLHSLRLVSPGGCLPVSANFCQSTLISHSKLKEKKPVLPVLKKPNKKISVIISLKVLMLIRFNFKYRFGNRSECQRTKHNQQK